MQVVAYLIAGILLAVFLTLITLPFWVFSLVIWSSVSDQDHKKPAGTEPLGGER